MKSFEQIVVCFFLFCLPVLCFAQDLLVKSDGTTVKCYQVDVGQRFVYYSLSKAEDADILKVRKEDVLAISREDGSKVYFDGKENELSAAPVPTSGFEEGKDFHLKYGDPTLPDVNAAEYKGFLCAKGNVAYVKSGGATYEDAGAEWLSKLLAEQGYWKVATRPEQAHFIIRYYVDTYGRDCIDLAIFDTRQGLEKRQIAEQQRGASKIIGKMIRASEDVDGNRNSVAKEVFSYICKLQKMMEKEDFKPSWFHGTSFFESFIQN